MIMTKSLAAMAFIGIASHAAAQSGPGVSYYTPFVESGGNYQILDVPGAIGSVEIVGISDSGEVAGTFQASNHEYYSFVESGGAYDLIAKPGATQTIIQGINSAGEVVGMFDVSGTYYNFVESNGVYTTLSFPNSWGDAYVTAINNAGDIVGGYNTNSALVGFEKSGNTFTTISIPGAEQTAPDIITNSGIVSGSSYIPSTATEPEFIESGGAFTLFYTPKDYHINAFDVNSAGTAVLNYGGPNTSFSVSGGVYTPIKAFGSDDTYASLINDAGSIAGFYTYPSKYCHYCAEGFLDIDGVYTKIGPPGATDVNIEAINGSNEVAGVFLADPIPEPAAWEVMLIGFGGAGWMARYRRKMAARPGRAPDRRQPETTGHLASK